MKAILVANIVLFSLLSACTSSNYKRDRPEWIDNPGSNFVGQCGTHVRGYDAQKLCAYKKGLAYIAMTKGVSVDVSANILMKQRSTEKTGRSFGQIDALVNMDEKNIKLSTSIINEWHDRVADIVYVLIKEN